MKQLKDAIMEQTKEMDGVKKELAETKKKCDEQIEDILKEVNSRIHIKDGKLVIDEKLV